MSINKLPIESNRAMRIKNPTSLASILGQDLREGCKKQAKREQQEQGCKKQANREQQELAKV